MSDRDGHHGETDAGDGEESDSDLADVADLAATEAPAYPYRPRDPDRLEPTIGLIGTVHGVHCNVHWDHNWIGDTPIDDVEHVVLYDFGIHWFDIVCCLVDGPPERVSASCGPSPSQTATPPLLGSATVEFENARATLVFDGDTTLGPEDRTVVTGGEGTLKSEGPDLEEQTVTVYTEAGYATPALEGAWFPDGFHGAMAELLSAVGEDCEPDNSGRNNLQSLELCFAAVASAKDHEPKVPGEVRTRRGFEPVE